MSTSLYFYLLNIIFSSCLTLVLASIQCVDENGKPVDWYVLYKLPRIKDSTPLVSSGSAYLYITPDTVDSGWTESNLPIQSEQSLLANTLIPLYATHNEQEMWLVYNDQIGLLSPSKFGHTKGVIAANKDGGFWLIHSIPRFPVSTSKHYSYPTTGYRNGQIALCITLAKDQIDQLGDILMYNRPRFMQKKISKEIESLYPKLVSAANGSYIKKAPWEMSTNIYSSGKRNFTVFAKAKKFNKDLYEWVAATFKTNILAETWLNELRPLPSTCSTYKVLNVEEIKFPNNSITFSSHRDHSKWAISRSINKTWICIGDINRAEPQEKRGGGTICLKDKSLWKAFNDIILKTSKCDSYYHSFNYV